MFPSSSQRRHWLFKTEQELATRRQEAYEKYLAKAEQKARTDNRRYTFLTANDEVVLRKQYEYYLKEFCRKFQPPMPRCVVGTSFHYFKRFYLYNSAMDYHPYEILLTCVYLAAKVEEFNVSIAQFVGNLKRNQEKIMDIILNSELLLMQQLQYHLTVHNPFRPVEGFLIDIKTRCPFVKDPESLRPQIDDFLDRSLFSDACLLFPPSQIALAAVIHSASSSRDNLESYVSDILLGSDEQRYPVLMDCVNRIREMVKSIEPPESANIKAIEKKLEKCRNPENNPESHVYKRKMQEMLDEEEGRSARKYARIAEEERKANDELLGVEPTQ